MAWRPCPREGTGRAWARERRLAAGLEIGLGNFLSVRSVGGLHLVLQCIQGAIVRIVKGNGQFIVNGKDVRLPSPSPRN